MAINETTSGKYLSDVLKRDANNFDILRLIAALGVIIGHAYAIAPQPPLQDGILSILHFDYSGSLAVKFFFFLSGLLVTNSIILKPNAFQFLAKRAFRIFPGLLVCLLVAVFIVGPIFTKVSLTEYFSYGKTWSYINKNFFLTDLQWKLTGVFSNSKYGLNGSLWTLPYEVLCYIYLAIFYGLGFLKNKIVANIFFITVIIVAFTTPHYLPAFFSQNPDSYLLPACFALGALFANNKEIIKIDIYHFILLWVFSIILNHSEVYQFIFYIAFFYSTIYIASLNFVVNKLKISFDSSYGIYIYGFMIQQCVFASLPTIGVHANQAITATIAICLGTLSWFFIEKPFVDYGHRVLNNSDTRILKQKTIDFLKRNITYIKATKTTTSSNILFFIFFTVLAFIIYAAVLKFIFPGYYSPLYPQHSDFYMPAAFANTPELTYIDLLSWPRSMNLIFAKFVGNFGIAGSIAWVIALVSVNVGLSVLLIKRILNIAFNWLLIIAFAGYCYLLFSHPYFYIFYAQDMGAQLSYFFLILGAYLFYTTFSKYFILSNMILLCCCVLAFLSKETYGLSALFFGFLWFIYYRKNQFLKACMPFFTISTSLIVIFLINIHIKSTFVNLKAAAGTPYQISLNPFSILHEWFLYLTEALNIFTVAIILLIGYLLVQYKKNNKKELIFIAIGCLVGMLVSILPNAILPNHHFKGYSFNGTYLLYLPLLFVPFFEKEKKVIKNVLITIVILCITSPILNIGKYKGNDWVLIQENTQRNLLKALEPLINNLEPSSAPKKILIEGISFPFHPFAFPQSLRVFPHATYATFDVVNTNPYYPNNKRIDLVKFINIADTALTQYDQKWIFDNNGKLITQTGSNKEEVLTNTVLNNEIKIDQENFSQFTTTGFYDQENNIRWTNGNASIKLKSNVTNIDTFIIELDTYMPPNCKNVLPSIILIDNANNIYKPLLTARKGDTFFYSFSVNKNIPIQKINILSQTIDASSDARVLSFPFISLEIKY
jgi:peptidoglycan/LPS O-acetylase OafA/YrhL